MSAKKSLTVLLAAVPVLWGLVQTTACGDDPGASFDGGLNDVSLGADTDDDVPGPILGDGGGPITSLTIAPQDPTVTVDITDGVVTTAPLVFQALGNGTLQVPATFALDRGELGTMTSGGTFTAGGTISGRGTVTAKYLNLSATTSVTVAITMSQNGGPLLDGGAPEAGLGGFGGVGGNGYGGPVDNATKLRLLGNPTPPANAQELGYLYPYDATVWPRGVLAPLVQWQTTHSIKFVYVHLIEKYLEFKGFYAGTSLVNQPVDQLAWKLALYSNSGSTDPLRCEIVVADDNGVWGPIKESWIVANGTLKGTVYYNSYNSRLTNASSGAVLSIKPGQFSPTVAVPGTQATCHVCHEVSADGSTLFTQDSTYAGGASYNLTNNNGTPIATYTGNAPDSTSNNRKFLWSAVYPDGTFAMSNARHAREHNNLNSNLFARTNGNAIATSGWTGAVTAAVTPMFSPDGKWLAFNFWEGPGANGVTAGAGRSLAIMDFSCGVADGGVACGAPPYAFSNLRELYRNNTRYPGWPAFLPDASNVVFHNTILAGNCGDCELATWYGAQADLWSVNAQGMPQPVALDRLNGLDGNKVRYLPTNGQHPSDEKVNYEPTVNPIASGGYFWVVFTSRRMYGNVAAGAPYDNGNGTYPIAKKLWVAAIDLQPAAGKDASHPAFYLPGQELNAGNLRGFWAVDPCRQNGTSCETGDECCGGFCRTVDGGLVCSPPPPGGCSQEFEKCTTDNDCCNAKSGTRCINGWCAQQPN